MDTTFYQFISIFNVLRNFGKSNLPPKLVTCHFNHNWRNMIGKKITSEIVDVAPKSL